MSRENITIEDRLHAAGYKTERIGDVVNVHDPIKQVVVGSPRLVTTGWRLAEIRNCAQAWAFIEERS
ncbi:hypothetical protein LNN35_20745 [Pseudomonas stutzeri]|jgi:hypothetical protein|uniref:hypothetical protein n=1 Tax=Gammaproteobacteria TaxID=1236 RepID=UPI001E443F88|nr:hypothetical protein [Stutzerimonas stutzeri]MCC8345194.1 hypothetical protein [Stutzerimonas stutzeri]